MTIDYILEISFPAEDSSLRDTVEGLLFQAGCAGSVITAGGSIEAYFVSREERSDAAAALDETAGVALAFVDREQVDWLDRYQQSLEPILIGERFIVAPDASLIPAASSRLPLIIPQEQAFGTGSHETTALCIESLEMIGVEGTGLDIGSGSGILALAMLRLGAKRVIAFDNDPDAYAALRENRLRNDIPITKMPIFIGGLDALRRGSFDVVTMNILPDIIVALLADVVARLGRKGSLILSGILTTRRDDVLRAAGAHGLTIRAERSRGEWWAGSFYGRDSIGR